MISIFADKSSLVIRKMLQFPARTWVIQDFTRLRDTHYPVSQGRAQLILNEMEERGYIEREKKGAHSNAMLANLDMLLEDWVTAYNYRYNKIFYYYSADKNILSRMKNYFKEKALTYALTLHTGANFISSYIATDAIQFYLGSKDIKQDIVRLCQHLELKQLVNGGNIHIIKPYYKHSVFFNLQKIKGYCIVSNAQLYIDLYHYHPRGREHALCLRDIVKKEGKHLD